MKRHAFFLLCVFLLSSPFIGPAFSGAPDVAVLDRDEGLLAFVHLGHFSDRGIIGFFLRFDPKSKREAWLVAGVPAPREVLALLEMREANMSQVSFTFPWLIEIEDRSTNATLERFQKYGLVELFHCENSRLLDRPLTQRKALMNRYEQIVEQVATAVAATFSKRLTEAEAIAIAGHLRGLSIELDLEIVKSLSPDERTRVAKLVSYLLPGAIADSKRWNSEFALGSGIVDAKFRNQPPTRDR